MDAIDRLLASTTISVLPTPVDVVARWSALVRHNPATGAAIFDYQIVATMLGNGVIYTYTYDSDHFSRFTQLEVLTP